MSDESVREVGAPPARRAGGQTATDYKLFICVQCGFEYDEAKGAAREGFPAGTPWSDIPGDWCCPDCAVREKVDFEEVSEERKGAMK